MVRNTLERSYSGQEKQGRLKVRKRNTLASLIGNPTMDLMKPSMKNAIVVQLSSER
jgi:hypothetical protein